MMLTGDPGPGVLQRPPVPAIFPLSVVTLQSPVAASHAVWCPRPVAGRKRVRRSRQGTRSPLAGRDQPR